MNPDNPLALELVIPAPWAAGNNHRSIGGDGFGVRINHKDWNADVSVAWRTYGGIPQSDSNNNTPMAWATLGYKF